MLSSPYAYNQYILFLTKHMSLLSEAKLVLPEGFTQKVRVWGDSEISTLSLESIYYHLIAAEKHF